jgi:hypothetical protein
MLFLTTLLSLASAQESLETPDAQSVQDTPFDLSEAQAPTDISSAQLDWLRPSPKNLPQNPYGHIDFTAYSLEWGEVQVGLANIHAGILPRVQVGTSVPLNAIGVYNGTAKINLLRLGPVDLAARGDHYRYPMGELKGDYTAAGATMSVRVLKPWSLHLTGQYATMGLEGLPDTSTISPLVYAFTGADLDAWRAEAAEQNLSVQLDAEAITARVATDIRFNRRDSLIIQGQAMVWGSVRSGSTGDLEIPPLFGLDEALTYEAEGPIPLGSSYTASMAWQWSWKRSYLRLGVGHSSVTGAWLLQSTEYAMRFGGKTRRGEAQMRRGWRHNRKELRNGADSALAESAI